MQEITRREIEKTLDLIFKWLVVIVIALVLRGIIISCAPSQKEIDDHYNKVVMDSIKHKHIMDSLKNVNSDSLIKSIMEDLMTAPDTSK